MTAFARDEAQVARLLHAGAHQVAVGTGKAAKIAPFDLILEGVGGALLGDAAGHELTTFDARRFRLKDGGLFGGTSLYGFFLLEELTRPDPTDPSPVLADLALKLARKELDPSIGRRASWTHIDEVARALLRRDFDGKAVLTID